NRLLTPEVTVRPVSEFVETNEAPEDETQRPGLRWNRLQIIDVALIGVATWGAVELWAYAIQRM
ncbi:MAG: hypothetical protein ACK4UN_11345, partial [Limisphaerales bacterium]